MSKLLYVISRAVRQVKFETILKYQKWYLCQISRTNHAIICLYYYPQKVCNFTCRYFKLSWNTTALSQSDCRNFSCRSISTLTLIAPTSTYKFFTLIFIYFPRDNLREFNRRSKQFLFVDHLINSHNHFSCKHMDIVRRNWSWSKRQGCTGICLGFPSTKGDP